ncbi:MAG: hypothetical protein IJN70_05915 [Clostridia bacterium]|nr:hypothetical protein [Clostridia bacterium]
MKKEKISEIISLTDDRFIEEAAVVTKKPKHIFRYVGLAACLAVAVIAGIVISQSDFVTPPPVSTEETTGNESGGGKNTQEITPSPEIVTSPAIEIELVTEAEMMISPKWEDRITSDKFPEVMLGETSYASQRTEIAAENIESFISDAVMSGYDIYEDKTYTINAKVYSVKNISTDCAVAVKIGDESVYYVYVNVWYTPETLGDLIDAIDMKNTASFGKAYKNYTDYDKGEHINVIFADSDDSIVWNMILSDTSVKNIEYDRFKDMLISVSVDIPLLGYKNISLGVTKDGYIVTNIMSTQKCFFIGTEKAEAFEKYISENIAFKETATVYERPDGAVPGKGEITPGYNPDKKVTSPPYNPETDAVPPYAGTGQSTPPALSDYVIEATTEINK